MKTKTTVLASALGLASLAALLFAAPASAVPPPASGSPEPTGLRARLHERIGENLGLTAEQRQKIDALRTKQRAELQALAGQKDLTPEARREQGRAIMENYRTQILAELTPDQQKKAGEMRERAVQRAHQAGRKASFGPEARPGREMGPPPGNPLAIVAMADRIKDRMAEKLQLTGEQRDKLEHLGRDYRAQQRDLAKKHWAEMRAVLTPEQQRKVEEWKQYFGPGGPPHEMADELPPPPARH